MLQVVKALFTFRNNRIMMSRLFDLRDNDAVALLPQFFDVVVF